MLPAHATAGSTSLCQYVLGRMLTDGETERQGAERSKNPAHEGRGKKGSTIS